MSGTTLPKRVQRGAQMRDYKAVVRRKASDPSLSTSAAIRLAAKSHGKSPAAVQQAYYKMVKTLGEQGAAPQPINETVKTSGNGKVAKNAAASALAKQSLAGALRAIEALEKENASLLKKCDALAEQNDALRSRLAAIKAAL